MIHQHTDLYKMVLQKYNLEVEYIEDFGKVKKVYAKQGRFALKQTLLTDDQRQSFLHTIQNLHEKGYRYAAPIFQATTGEYLIQKDGNVFYLMPWIESNRSRLEDRQDELMKEIARIHSVTAISGKANQEYFKHFYENSKYTIEKRIIEYEQFINECEKQQYMSPFELLYCTHFVQLMQMEHYAKTRLDDWYEIAKEKKQDRVVICHGNLSPSHLLYDEGDQCYLTSFDRSFQASPIYDLLYFFKKTFYRYPQAVSKVPQWYSKYNNHHHLTEDERLLLFYYLTETSKIYDTILKYKSDRTISEISFVVKLQKYIWQLQSAHSFVRQISEQIEQAKIDQLMAEENEATP